VINNEQLNGDNLKWIKAESIDKSYSVYVDATDTCNTAAFQLGQTAIGTSIPSRSWNIKARKYDPMARLSTIDLCVSTNCTETFHAGKQEF
jgi:hypothetical protein